jgi:DNA-binding transcriptional MerR regulator
MRYPIVIVPTVARLGLETFASRGGVHPELVRRLVALGLLEATRDASGALWFAPEQVPVLARIRRLHADLSLNYAAIGLVLELLDRIRRLEGSARSGSTVRRQPPWT